MKTYNNFSSSLISKPFVKKEEYLLETFKRSNQDTCLTHKPAINEGAWVQSGDLLTDCASSVGGELSLGQNLLIAYMPWEGYNFEDAILISERLVMDDLYTSIHIERYELEIQKTKLGIDEITRNIPDASEKDVAFLDSFGVIKIGSWVEEGDILVGKTTPISKRKMSPYQKLLYTILEKQVRPIKDSSLRAPKGIKAKVIDIKYFLKSSTNLNKKISNELYKKNKKNELSKSILNTLKQSKPQNEVYLKKLERNLMLLPFTKSKNNLGTNEKSLGFRAGNINGRGFFPKINFLFSKIKKNSFNIRFTYFRYIWLKAKTKYKTSFFKANSLNSLLNNVSSSNTLGVRANTVGAFAPLVQRHLGVQAKQKQKQKLNISLVSTSSEYYSFGSFGAFVEGKKGKKLISNHNKTLSTSFNLLKKKELLIKNIEKIHIYLAEKRKIQVGDKMAGRHGNKGIVSQILPIQDMPYLPDGTPIDMVLNPLGVPSRMNVGQIYECLLGLAGKFLGENYKVYSFDEIYGPEASRAFVFNKLYEARSKTGFKWLFDPNSPGKIRLCDGRNGIIFDQKVTVGQAYMLRLVHMVDDKIHMRSTGPYSLVTQQPLRGRSKQGGQRLGEMEVWALEGYGAAFTLLEMLTIKSDDMTGRMTLWSNLILNKDISIGTPESFKVLVCELQALCLDIGLFRNVNVKSNNKNSNLREITNLMNLP